MRDQTHSDGRRESWATEAVIHAASALYEMNISDHQHALVKPYLQS